MTDLYITPRILMAGIKIPNWQFYLAFSMQKISIDRLSAGSQKGKIATKYLV